MRKITILTLSLVLLLCLSSFASETRVMTMGENNNVLIDEANVSLYPGRIVDYPNLAVGEFSYQSDEFTNFGINWEFGSNNPWVLGTYFSTEGAFGPNDFKGNSLVNWDYTLQDNRRLTLLYGRNMGANKFGFSLGYYNSSQEYENNPVDGNAKESFKYYDLGFGLTEGGGMWDLAVNFGFGSWTDEDLLGATESEPDGYYDFGLKGRYFMQRGPNYTYIPHVGISTSKHAIKMGAATETYKMTELELGMGMNYMPSNSVLAVMDFGFSFNNWSDESDDGTNPPTEIKENGKVIPYFRIGLDAELLSWADIRFGATSDWNSDEEDFDTYKNKYSHATNDTYLGFGFHWGNLHVDTYANPELFFNGFNFVSGGDVEMNWQLSTVYEF